MSDDRTLALARSTRRRSRARSSTLFGCGICVRASIRSSTTIALGAAFAPARRRVERGCSRSGPRCSSGPKGGGSRPSRAARRRRDGARCDRWNVGRWRDACASGAQGEPPTEAEESPRATSLAARIGRRSRQRTLHLCSRRTRCSWSVGVRARTCARIERGVRVPVPDVLRGRRAGAHARRAPRAGGVTARVVTACNVGRWRAARAGRAPTEAEESPRATSANACASRRSCWSEGVLRREVRIAGRFFSFASAKLGRPSRRHGARGERGVWVQRRAGRARGRRPVRRDRA
jgi:hypothetical protein